MNTDRHGFLLDPCKSVLICVHKNRRDIASFCFDEAERTGAFEWRFACTADGVHNEIDGMSIVEFEGVRIVRLRDHRMAEQPYGCTCNE